MLADAFPVFFWTGFYVVDADKGDELVVGPYQGTPGCLRRMPAANRASLGFGFRTLPSADQSISR